MRGWEPIVGCVAMRQAGLGQAMMEGASDRGGRWLRRSRAMMDCGGKRGSATALDEQYLYSLISITTATLQLSNEHVPGLVLHHLRVGKQSSLLSLCCCPSVSPSVRARPSRQAKQPLSCSPCINRVHPQRSGPTATSCTASAVNRCCVSLLRPATKLLNGGV